MHFFRFFFFPPTQTADDSYNTQQREFLARSERYILSYAPKKGIIPCIAIYELVQAIARSCARHEYRMQYILVCYILSIILTAMNSGRG